MSVEAVISTQVIDTTSVGRSIMTAADAAAVRTAADAQVTLVSGTNIKTVNSTSLLGSGDIAVGVSGTGAVDNAALRADGTGGATLQSSAFVIADNGTASPNNTVNHASIAATGGTTNVSVSIVPKGTGAFCLAVPDGTTTGGNARGANAIDLSTTRSTATEVASGPNTINIGRGTASGIESIQIGNGGASTGFYTVTIGRGCSADYYYGVAIGHNATAFNNSVSIGSEYCTVTGSSAIGIAPGGASVTGPCATALGRGVRATRVGEYARATGSFFSTAYDRMEVGFQLSCVTTNNTPTNMLLAYYGGTARLTLASGRLLVGILQVTGQKSDGSAVAIYTRRVALKNVGGTTTLIQSLDIGTDYEDNAATAIAITADDANDALQVAVTGIAAETWRWFGLFYPAVEFAYGT